MAQKLHLQLKEVGSKLEILPSSKDALIKLLKQASVCLAELDQSPSASTLESMKPFFNAIVKPELLKHQDRDVKLLVATCVCEITRITAPEAPYNDDVLKDIFQLIVGILSETVTHKSAENAQHIQSCMNILVIIARFSPFLLNGSEEELVNLLKDNNDMIREGVLHVLAKAGGTIREQLAVTSSSVGLMLEAHTDGEGAPLQMMEGVEKDRNAPEESANSNVGTAVPQPLLSKNAQKKLLKQQRFEAKKAEKKALVKEQKKRDAERKRKEWEESLASVPEEERVKLIESRKSLRKERMDKRSEEKEKKRERLCRAKECGQNVIIDLDFSDLMTPAEIHSLVQQIMYCYAVNGRCTAPAHLWLTGCNGEMENQLKRIPGFDKWIIEKENKSYIEALQDCMENLVYLTADSDIVLEELDLKKIYIIGGLVDRNRWKGITMKKAREQGIQTAKLPIGNFMKMSSSQVLTVNQVLEILLKFLETRDWKASFFAVIPQRKRWQTDSEENAEDAIEEENEKNDDQMASKKKCVDVLSNS